MANIPYKTVKRREVIGDLRLDFECIDDFNQTIDQIFLNYQQLYSDLPLEKLFPYFGVLWPSARGLASYLASMPAEELQNKKVLELGCGLAIPSMVASIKGATVIASDFHPEVERFLEVNKHLNQLSHLEFRNVDWEAKENKIEEFDIIIGSDLLYEKHYPPLLSQMIVRFLGHHGKVILTDPGRLYLQEFVDKTSNLGLKLQLDIIDVDHQEIFLLTLKKALT